MEFKVIVVIMKNNNCVECCVKQGSSYVLNLYSLNAQVISEVSSVISGILQMKNVQLHTFSSFVWYNSGRVC